MSEQQEKVFERMLVDAGVPVTATQVDARFQTMATDANYPMTNSNPRSPFWRLLTRAFTEPVVWLTRTALIKHLLPNSFLMTAKGAWLDLIARGFDIERHEAVAAQHLLRVVRRSAVGEYTLPAGTVVQSPEINGRVYELATTTDVTFPAGELEVTVLATAAQTGSAYNLDAGYYTILKKPLTAIAQLSNPPGSLTVPGVDEEDDEALRLRVRSAFHRLGRFHVDEVYKSLIAGHFPQLGIDNIWLESQSAPRGPGTVNIYILMQQGAPGAAFLAALNKFVTVEGFHGHGDDVLVLAMPTVPTDLSVTVRLRPNTPPAEKAALLTEIEQRIRCAFRENAAFADITRVRPNSVFSFSNLACELHDALPKLASITFSLDEIACGLNVPALADFSIAEAS